MKRAIVKNMAETTACRSHCQYSLLLSPFLFTVNVIRKTAPPFSKVDSNKLWRDVQNEETVICAKFGKDKFNISKVIGRKTKWPRFLAHPVNCSLTHLGLLSIAGDLILIYDLWLTRSRGMTVVQYHHATPPTSPMRRMKWCNGHGSWVNYVMGHIRHGSRKMTHFHFCCRLLMQNDVTNSIYKPVNRQWFPHNRAQICSAQNWRRYVQ